MLQILVVQESDWVVKDLKRFKLNISNLQNQNEKL